MLSVFDGFRNITLVTVLLRILISFVCGLAIGLERSVKNRPAGFRTHILVCLGAATASMTGHYIYLNMQMPADPTRLGAQIITGLGFIGAGTIIITKKQTVKGLTTAAGLWASGIVGLAVGAGFYEGGIITAVLIILVETLLSNVGHNISKLPSFRIILHYNEKEALDHVMRLCKDYNLAIADLQVSGTTDEDLSVYSAYLFLRSRAAADKAELIGKIREVPGVFSIEEL